MSALVLVNGDGRMCALAQGFHAVCSTFLVLYVRL